MGGDANMVSFAQAVATTWFIPTLFSLSAHGEGNLGCVGSGVGCASRSFYITPKPGTFKKPLFLKKLGKKKSGMDATQHLRV